MKLSLLIVSCFLTMSLQALSNVEEKRVHEAVSKADRFPKESEKAYFNCTLLNVEKASQKLNQSMIDAEKILETLGIFEVETKNFSPGTSYNLYSVNLKMKTVLINEFIASSEGRLFQKSNGMPIINQLLIANGFMKGEPCFYVLISDDKTPSIASRVVSRPLEVFYEDGALIDVEIMNHEINKFNLRFSGFKPLEQISFLSQCDSESTQFHLKANKEGFVEMKISLATAGKKGGVAFLTVKRQCSEAVKEVKIPWGSAAKI